MSEIYTYFNNVEVYIKSGSYKIEIDTGLPFPLSNGTGFYSGATDQTLITSIAKSGLWIDFPVNIIGDGDSTEIEVVFNYSSIESWSNTNASDRLIAKKGFIGIGGSNLQTFPSYPGYQNISSGKIRFFNLKFLNTSIALFDTDVILGPGNEVLSGLIDIDYCRFQNDLIDEDRERYRSAIIYNRQSPHDSSNFIGGLSVKNNYFKYTNILFTSPDNASFYREEDRFLLLEISNNIVESPGKREFLETTGILSKFTETTNSFSPKIFNNTYIGNRGKTTSQSSYWVSTIPTGLNIHGDIKVGNISGSSISNSNVSEFYTNVYLKSGYTLTLESGTLTVNGRSNLNGPVSAESLNSNGDIKSINGNIIADKGNFVAKEGSLVVKQNVTAEEGGVTAKQDIVSTDGKLTSKMSVYTEGPMLYGYGESLSTRTTTDAQTRISKRKNSHVYTAADFSHPNSQTTTWEHLSRIPRN